MINRGSYIRALVLLNLLNSLRKRDKMLGKLAFYLFSPTRLINSIKHEHSCKIFYLCDRYSTLYFLHGFLVHTFLVHFPKTLKPIRITLFSIKYLKNKNASNTVVCDRHLPHLLTLLYSGQNCMQFWPF